MNHQHPAEEPKTNTTSPQGAGDDAAAAEQPVADADEETPDTQEEIVRLTRERDEYLDMARRIQAEFENFRRRNRELRQEALAEGAAGVIEAMLPVLDNLERAELAAVETGSGAVAEGVGMVLRIMREALSGLGVREIEADGKPFDPTLHNAVMRGPADAEHPPGTVLEVLQKGYAVQDKVLRHSMVNVAQ
jgi:molecular chaperone GrpE